MTEHKWIIGRRWFIAHCKPQMEWKAASNARENGWETFMPWFVKARKNGGGRIMGTKLPLLPGYLFATGDRFLSIYALKNPMYVNRLLGPEDDPYQIPDTDPIMRALLKKADVDGFVAEAKEPLFAYKIGDTINIVAGPFQGLDAKIEHMGKRQLEVWADVFGRPTLIKLPHEQVKRRVVA